MIFDKNQLKLFDDLNSSYNEFKKVSTIYNKFVNKVFKKSAHNGFYIQGKVGTGKTIAVKSWLNKISSPTLFLHFQVFSQNFYKDLNYYRNILPLLQTSLWSKICRYLTQLFFSNDTFVELVAKKYASLYKIIAIDEFEINDIVQAQAVSQLLPLLNEYGIFIIITTNLKPSSLYSNGVGRDSFLPFIAYINYNYLVFVMNSDIDYRGVKIASLKQRIIYPFSIENKNLFNKQVAIYSTNMTKAITLKVLGREFALAQTTKDVLVSNFSELFLNNFAVNDYIAICDYFLLIFIDDIKVITVDNDDVYTRFINFIDQAYLKQILIIGLFELVPTEIISSTNSRSARARCLSRLNEMNSEEYLVQSKYYQNHVKTET